MALKPSLLVLAVDLELKTLLTPINSGPRTTVNIYLAVLCTQQMGISVCAAEGTLVTGSLVS